MSVELELSGKAVHFVNINITTGIETQEEILKHCTFPQLQDTDALNIWERLDGYKDDFFILDSAGVMRRYIAFSDDKSTLSEEEDYAFIKDSILEVVAEDEAGVFSTPDTEPGPSEDMDQSDAATSDEDTTGASEQDSASEPEDSGPSESDSGESSPQDAASESEADAP